MPPGLRFVERQLSEETGYGATPVREALDRLSQEGLIRTIPRHGYQVTPVDAKYVRDFFDVWSPVVTTLHRLALANATEDQHQSAAQAAERFGDVQSDQGRSILDVVDELNLMLTFIAEIADNEHLSAIWHRLSGVCTRVFNIASLEGEELRSLNHRLFLAAWEERNVLAVVGIIEHFVEKSRLRTMAIFEQRSADAEAAVSATENAPVLEGAPAASD